MHRDVYTMGDLLHFFKDFEIVDKLYISDIDNHLCRK